MSIRGEMSMDWWFNVNHMEGLTDRCYQVTISSESQSGDSLGGKLGFLKGNKVKKWKLGPRNTESILCDIFFPQGLFLSYDIFWLLSLLPGLFENLYLAYCLFLLTFVYST